MPPEPWTERTLSENRADELLFALGYTRAHASELAADRDSPSSPLLTTHLRKAIHRLNPWISRDNATKALRELSHLAAPGLLEANEAAHVRLLLGATVEQAHGGSKRNHTALFIDFDSPENNEFLFCRQFAVKGSKREVQTDITLFVNGIPLVVIECKNPTDREPLDKGVIQLVRYQELTEEFRGLGAPRLFHTVQFVVATCGEQALYAPTGAADRRHFAEWKTAYPQTDDGLQVLFDRPVQPQDRLLAGMCSPKNLLDLVRNFVVFEVESQRTVKKLARYQQFLAVNKALARIAEYRGDARGGVIWHTQGSGKSLTMVYLAVKLRRLVLAANPTLVIVTDRRDLDQQIAETFGRCGFPNPQRAETIHGRHNAQGEITHASLRELLRGPSGKTVMTTIQKFQTPQGEPHPTLTRADNVFVLVDEAHRTQYSSLAANMRSAMPNACFIAFTGTPLEKSDRDTRRTFGDYIDKYTIEQSVADGATVPIFYEMRAAKDRVEGDSLDRVFDRVFRDRPEEERAAIRSKFATLEAVASAPQRIRRIAEDIVDHFEKFIRPGGFKAQIVACSREVAVRYKETLDELGAPQSAVIISAGHNDPETLAHWHRTPTQHKQLTEEFKKRGHPLEILVVCDMLLTGFDAPVEQVMYLDAPLREHTLLQAIARVNRTAEGKDYGLVVDYWGVSEHLEQALAVFAREDLGTPMRHKADEIGRLQLRHAAVMRFFANRDRNDAEACLAAIEAEDVRAQFDAAFRRFGQSLDLVLPDPVGLPYQADLRWLGKLRNLARNRFRDEAMDLSGCREKVKKLIEDYLRSDGVCQLLKPVSILAPEFEQELARLNSDDAKASEMEHALRHETTVRLDENPAYYMSLSQRLQQIIDDRKAARLDAAEALQRLRALADEARGIAQTAAAHGLDEEQFAVYQLLGQEQTGDAETGGPALRAVAKDLVAAIRELAVVDWVHKEDTQRRMRQELKTRLRAAGYDKDAAQTATLHVLDLARARASR